MVLAVAINLGLFNMFVQDLECNTQPRIRDTSKACSWSSCSIVNIPRSAHSCPFNAQQSKIEGQYIQLPRHCMKHWTMIFHFGAGHTLNVPNVGFTRTYLDVLRQQKIEAKGLQDIQFAFAIVIVPDTNNNSAGIP